MYTGRDELRERPIGEHVPLLLSRNLAGSGLNITVDNFFCSLELARLLLQRNMTLLGTIRSHRREVPLIMRSHRQRDLHSSTFLYTPEDTIQLVSYKAKASKVVILLSSQHSTSAVENAAPYKPRTIMDYNETKGGVDVMDKLVGSYTVNINRKDGMLHFSATF